MNFSNYIDELIEEIKVEIRNSQLKKEKVLDEWNKFAYENPNQSKNIKEIEEKLEAASSEEEVCVLSDELLNLRKQNVKYELGEKEKQRKIDMIHDEKQLNIMKLIKKKIMKINENIDLVNEQFDEYAKNIFNAKENSSIDLRTLSSDFRNFDGLKIAIDVLNKYDGRVAKESLCRELVEGLDETNKKIIVDLYRIITRFSINMNQDVVIEKEEVRPTEISESDIIELIKQESAEETKEVISEEADKIDEVEEKNVLKEENEVLKEENEVVIEENHSVKTSLNTSNDEMKNQVSNFNSERQEFLSMYRYLCENEPTEDDILDFTLMFDSLSNVDLYVSRAYDKIVKKYNNKAQFELTKNIGIDALEHYTFDEIIFELYGKAYKKIMNSGLVYKINSARLNKAKSLAEDETLGYEIRDKYMDKTDNIINTISGNFVISGVRYYINKNKLSDLKLKLYENDNKMLSTKFERKLKKVSRKVSNKMSKELKKLMNRKLLTQESIYLILDQYLELLSICDKNMIYTYKLNFNKFLSSIGSKRLEDIYVNASRMIVDYRIEHNFIPYELRRIHNGVVHSEIEDMINYYDVDKEALQYPERGKYIKNVMTITEPADKIYKKCCK